MTIQEQSQKNGIYKDLAYLAGENLVQLKAELDYFNAMARKDIFNKDRNYKLTCEIIRNLKDRLSDEKREYIRFKAVSESC